MREETPHGPFTVHHSLRAQRGLRRKRQPAILAVSLWMWSSLAVLAAPPAITTQPQNSTVIEGTGHTFSVTATGAAPLSYQWRRNASTLAGQTNSTLPLTAIQTSDAGGYSVVVTNAEGATTSLVAQLTVRLVTDPVYPTPQGGWAYIYQGTGISSDLTAALDGTWNHETDAWSGDGRGTGNGLAGGVSTTNGVLTIEDNVASGAGFNNRRYYFTHNLAQETAVTNASTLLNDGVTLTFRARLTPSSDPLIELTNAPNGLVNYSDGKGMFGLRQAGGNGLLVSFSLSQASEDTNTTGSFNFAQAGLHVNNLNGDARSATIDPGEGGTTNLLALDSATFHEFWITIQDNGADPGTHRVSVYLDGSKTPTRFNVTAGSGYDGPATNYLALGMGSSAQRGGFDVDFLGYQSGVILPSAFNEPVGIALQPVTQYVAPGQVATYNVGVTGTPPYSFQWYRDGAAIPAATNANYSTAPVTSGDAGAQFLVVASNEFNSVTSSPPATLQLLGPPAISTHPSSLTVTNGDTATFTVVASSSVTPTYQWRFNGGNLTGQTNATLTVPGAAPANAGNYDVIVANDSGSVTSTPAVLTIVLCDYGDAPDPAFPTLRASNGATHKILPGVFLGGAIDAEIDGQPTAGANGDDAIGDDEDGVAFLTSLLAGQDATVEVVASTNGLLNAWLDFDRNGTWSGVGEQIFTNTPLAAGTNLLVFRVPGLAAPGASHARFRFNTTGGLSFNGPAADGEVEDNAATLLPVADLSVAQTALPDPIGVNASLTCSITISNAGPSAAGGVATTNLLPAGVNFQSVLASQGSCLLVGSELSCDLGTLASGGTATVTLQIKPATAGPLTNTVRVSSAAADLASANNLSSAIVTVLAPPAITTPPLNLTVTNGSPATFTVAAAGAAPLSYQWRFNGADLSGATNATLTISNAQPVNAGPYTVRITNQVGSVTSAVATLTVLLPPSFTLQPQSQTNLAGGTAVFTATGVGTAPLAWQWRFNNTGSVNGIVTSDGATSTLTLPNLQLTNAGNYTVVLSNPAGAITSAVATLTIIALDFGDAPDTYRTTLGTNGARHRIVPAIRLGATVDFEPDGQPDASATGDDTIPLTDPDDEDGIIFTTPIRAGQTATFTAVASTNGVLNAWLDYNRNGTWADPGEQIFLNRLLSTGTNNVSFLVPGTATAGLSYARFRFSTATNLTIDGEAPSGEVEDYAVTIEAVSDLAITRLTQISPITTGSNQIYNITITNAGPSVATAVSVTDTLPVGVSYVTAVTSQGSCSHSAGLVVCALGDLNPGASVTLQIDTIPLTAGSLTNSATVGGNQTDLNPANNSLLAVATVQDLPAITFQPQSQIVTNGGSTTFSVTASGTALRYQWLQNGVAVTGATNATLALANVQPANAGTYTVRVTNLVGTVLSAPATLTVLGPVTIITQPQSQSVLSGSTVTLTVAASGSPPITYQWEFDGADLPGQTGATLVLTGVQTNEAGAYRVRVTNPIGSVNSAVATLTVLELPNFLVQPQSATNAAGGTATLTTLAAGTTPLTYQWYFNQATLLAGQTNATLAFTNVQTSRSGAYTVMASNIAGVRTSAVAVLTVYELDFGDAPEAAGYPTTLAFNGARHRLLPGVRLGTLADFETNGAPNITANGDDLAGVDDEDGVLFPATLLVGQNALVPVIASTNGYLDAWIDFNGNGSWGDPGEQVLASRPLSTGTNPVPITISPGALPGLRYARCRFSTGGGLPYDGLALDGEVEDHRVSLLPAVDLAIGLEDLTDPVAVSSNLLFLMTVTNRGPSTATSVMLTNYLPTGYTYLEATPSQGYCGDIGTNTVFCPVDSIAPGGVVTMLLTVRPNAPGTYTNTALAAAAEAEANPGDNTAAQSTSVVLPPTSHTNAAALPVADATPAGPGVGSPYPSTILVTGQTSAVFKVTVRLNNLSHPLSKDFDVLLVGPSGQATLLMSDAGAGSLGGVTLTFDDAAETALPSTGVIATGTYRPSNYGAGPDEFPTGAPPPPPGPYANSLAVFNGTDPNGTWKLYIVDALLGGSGSMAGGWQLSITTTDPIADTVLAGSVNGIVINPATALTDPIKVPVNSNLLYTLTLTNRGPAVANNAVLTNTLPPGVTFVSVSTTLGACSPQGSLVACSFGDLNAGASATINLTLRPTVLGLHTNSSRATASRLDHVPANNFLPSAVAARLVTDLTVAQSASTNLLLLGEQMIYTLNITNRGPNPATNIRLVDTLPESFTFLSASATQGACANAAGVITCDLGALASGARAQVTLQAAPTVLGLVTNRAQVTGDEVETFTTNNTTQISTLVNVAADLGVTLADSPDPAAVGDALIYELVVTNRGPSFAYDVQLTNTLPPNAAFLWAAAPDGICAYTNGTVQCALGIITPGASTSVTIAVTPTTAGRLTNTARVATLSVDAVPANNVATVTTDAAFPPVILAPPQNVAVTNGGTAVFTVNAGPQSGTNHGAVLRYQWSFTPSGGPQAGRPAGPQAGATNATFTIANTQPGDAGSYQVTVSNYAGLVTSLPATLRLLAPPTLSDLPDTQTDEDTPSSVLPFIVTDPDGTPDALTMTYTSSDTNLLPVLAQAGGPAGQQPGVTFGGSGANRWLTLLPATNRFGAATITLHVRDAYGLTAADTFVLTVRPVNDPPAVSDLLNRTMLEDTGLAIPFQVNDAENPPEALTLGITTTNPVLFPAGNLNLSGVGTSRLLILQPALNQSGNATLRLTLTDTNGASTSEEFDVSVAPVNDLPTITAIADQTIDQNSATADLPFTVADVETTAEALLLTYTSSNTNLVPAAPQAGGPAGVAFSGAGGNRTVRVTPTTNQFGATTITLTVTDTNAGASTRTFQLTVRQTLFPPAITSQPLPLTVTNGGSATFAATLSGTQPIYHQWKRNGTDLAGGTNAILTLTNVQAAQAGAYTLLATNLAGQALSAPAQLRVLVSPTITTITRTQPTTQISFSTEAGLSYTVEFKNAPEAPAWDPLAPATGTGGVLTVTDPDATVPSRIYRVRVE
jgi:uncharacterized repeat protein (TIGR01451 family)